MQSAPNSVSSSFLDLLQQLRQLLDNLPSLASFVDADGRYRIVNREYERWFGKPRDAIEHRPIAELHGTENYRRIEPNLRRAFAGESVHYETVIADGPQMGRVLDVHYAPWRQPDGKVAGVFVLAFDVTNRKEAENAVRRSEARWKLLLEHNPDFVILIERDSTIRFVNRTLPGQTPEELLGAKAIQFIPPDRHSAVLKALSDAWDTNSVQYLETPGYGPDGRVYRFHARIVPVSEEGRTTMLMVLVQDITERVEMSEALRESEDRFRRMADVSDQVFWFASIEPQQILYVSPSFEDIWGLTADELYGDPRLWIDSVHREDRPRVLASTRRLLERKAQRDEVEYRIVRRDGSVRWIHDHIVALADDGGRIAKMSGIARDVTDRKAAEEERAAFERKMQETQKLESLGVLAGGIAHDFNNLLTGILGNVNLAQLEAPAGSPLQQVLFEAERICVRSSELCKQMLAYAGKGRFMLAPIDLSEAIREIEALLRVSAARDVRIELQLADRMPMMEGDPTQVRQVVLNLALNAAEACGDGPGSVRIGTGATPMTAEELKAFRFGHELAPGTYLFLEVADNGAGMLPDVAERIFEPFFTTKFTGRGLGLSAVLGIVRSHRGAIRVRSTTGQGTVITVLFPPSEKTPPPLLEPTRTPWQGEGLALVADDQDSVRRVLAKMLEKLGLRCIEASDGREAVERFAAEAGALKLAMLDVTMPRMTGEEAAAEMARIAPTVPIVLMSGYAEQDLMRRSQGKGIAGVLVKPFRLESLETLLRQIFARSAPAERVDSGK